MVLLTPTSQDGIGRWQLYRPQSNVSLTVSGGATPSNTSDAVDALLAKTISLRVKCQTSTNLDILVYASEDESNYDSEHYASMNLGAGKQKTIPISPGPRYLKVKADNKDAANAATVDSWLLVTK